jgi:hypothetical protein
MPPSNTQRWILTVAALGALVGVVVLAWVLAGRHAPEPERLPEVITRGPASTDAPTVRGDPPPKGGVYAGTVVDAQGAPIADAKVLLVAQEGGDRLPETAASTPEEWDPSQVAVIGPRLAGEGTTDAQGRFQLAADARSQVAYVLAHGAGYVLSGVAVNRPRNDLRIVLQAGGEVVGTVVDGATGSPVAGADVAIAIQSRQSATRDAKAHPLAQLQLFVTQVLGQRVWGIPYRGDELLHVTTDQDGRFRFAPIGNEVQLEFVVTHADYAWTEQDPVEGNTRRRTVVEPGQTVERTFRLEKGNFIAGKVLDKQGMGVPDVRVQVEHVVQRAQHWWYRVRMRQAKTGPDGSFRVAGLSHGPYTVTLRHASFGSTVIDQVPENFGEFEWHVEAVGALAGTVEGLDRPTLGTKVEVILEAVDPKATSGGAKRWMTLDAKGGFEWTMIEPRPYNVWVRAGNRSSIPQEVVIRSGAVSPVTFVLGGGGMIELEVLDASGRRLDPASATLLRIQGAQEQPIAQFVSRAGRVDADGISPGRYRLLVRSEGYIPRTTQPFDVDERSRLTLEPVTLPKQAMLKIVRFEISPRLRAERADLYVQEGDGPARLVQDHSGRGIPVTPGRVTVRAVGRPSGSFEKVLDVPDGATVPVEIRVE